MTGENLEGFNPQEKPQEKEEKKEIKRASDIIGNTFLSVIMVTEQGLVGNQKIANATVETIQKEDEPEQRKIGITFEGHSGNILLLNKTNTKNLMQAYGDEFEGWAGKMINLSIAKVDFMGKIVDSIRIEAVK